MKFKLRITCDANCNMGYIYLAPPKFNIDTDSQNHIEKALQKEQLIISHNETINLDDVLENMKRIAKSYKQAFKEGDIKEEFSIDFDRNGYLMGIEMNLSKEDFISLIESQVFKVYTASWESQKFIMVTLDLPEKVFDAGNVIYPLSNNLDAFVIIDREKNLNNGAVKSLITVRDDIYPLDYLINPDFVLWDE